MSKLFFFFFVLLAVFNMSYAKEPCCDEPFGDGGNCYGDFERFGYNPATGACETFPYGGCGGNNNQFAKLESCQEACLN